MNYQKIYEEGKKANYSDEEITNYLLETDPNFSKIINEAEEANYSPEEVLTYFNTPQKEKEFGFSDYAEDIGKQTAQGVGIGALGTYGDILDLLGVQAKEVLPGEKEKYKRESEVLGKIDQGQVPSWGEFEELSSDDVIPRYSKLPSTQEVESFGKELGLTSEPKSAAGRYGKRIGKLSGGGLSLGATGLASPIAAGVAGQTLEEAGAPPWAQAAGEIIASLKFAKKTPSNISSKSKEVEDVIQNLRKAGYTEKDITLAKSALEERKLLKKYASLTPEAENSINAGIKNSENLFKDQIKKGLPGYAEGGLPYLEKQASNVYQTMEELASSIPIKNTEPVKKSIQGAIDYLEKYPLLKEQKDFIEFMKDGLNKLQGTQHTGKLAKPEEGGLTAEFLTGFYRNLGKAGNWGDPKQKEHLLGLVKQGIKDTFAESGPEAAKFGKYFDTTNEAWKKWLNARDLMQTIEKTQNVDGMNFKKLTSILNDPQNHELAKKVLGLEQVNNIKSISQGAQAIESLLKQIPKNDKSIQSLKILEGVRSLLTGDYRPMAAILTLEGAKRLSTKLLTDPEKQNVMKRLITAAKNNSPQQAEILAQELIKEDSSQAKASEEPHPKPVKR